MNCKICGCEINARLYTEVICRPCYCKRWNENRAKRKEKGTLKQYKMPPEYHQEYNRKRAANNPKIIYKYSKDARLRNPEKYNARQAVKRAILKGTLIKNPCIVCGDKKVEAHHEDYSKPLDVKWLCKKHHLEVHGKISRQ